MSVIRVDRVMASNSVKSTFVKLLILSVMVLVNGHFAMAQVSASINGKVQDASGAAIPDVAVTVISSETATTHSATSDDQGDYRILSLPVGRYQIKAEKSGFKTFVQSGIDLVVGQQAVLNLALEVGQVQQQVTVTADAPVVNTSTVSTAGLVGEAQVKDLPLNGRSFDNLITLNAGAANVTTEKTAGATAQNGNLFSISGRVYWENEFLLNGVEYPGPNAAHSVPGGVSGQLLGIDAVREFNVQSDAYDAQYGKRAGGQVSVVTQSGTNQLHGSVFEFIRNSVLDARNHFDHPLGERIPPFKRNQFGAALGGPIRKDKTFLFGNYEGFRQRLGNSGITFVPSANARNGFQDPTPVNGVCATGTTMYSPLVSGMLPYLSALWPAANGPCIGNGIAENISNPLQSIREDFATVRADQIFSTKDTLGISYLFDNGHSIIPQPTDIDFGQVTNPLRAQVLSVQETHIFSPTLVNTATFGFSRVYWRDTAPSLVPIPPNLLFVPGQFLGRVSIGGNGSASSGTIGGAGGGKLADAQTGTNRFTYADSIQMIKGRHVLSAGVWFQPLQTREFLALNAGGTPTFSSLTQFMSGVVSSFQVAPVTTTLNWNQFAGAWYVQDIIQLRPNLTLRLGLRHEFTNGWTNPDGQSSNFVYGPDAILQTAPMVGNSPFTQNNTKLLFGPRVGIAWDPFGKGKTSIRAGFGTHFDVFDTLGFALDGNPPTNGVVSFSNANFLSLIPVNPATPVPPPCGPGVTTTCTTYAAGGYQPNLKTPTVEEWNLTVEQQLTPNTSFMVAYVGSHMFHGILDIAPDTIMPQICSNAAGCLAGGINAAASQTPAVPMGTQYIPVGKLPNPFLANGSNYLASENNASYNALEAGLTHRFSAGLQFRANYTWSKTMDISSGYASDDGTESGFLLDAYNPKLDWGPAGDNKTNKFVFSGSYELPFGSGKRWANGMGGVGNKFVSGWQVNTIVSATSGFSFDQEVGSNRSGDGDTTGGADRPFWNPSFTGNPVTGNPNQWFNPDAFTLCGPGSTAACTQIQGENDRFYAGLQTCATGVPLTTVTCAPPSPQALTGTTFGTYTNVGRNVLYGPALVSWDMSLFKTTEITERVKLEFRAEGFNILNHTNYSTPGLVVFAGATPSPTAGIITTTATTSRQLQFGMKLLF